MLPNNPVLLVPARSVVVASDHTITTNFLARTSGLDATHTTAYKNLINGMVNNSVGGCTDTTWGIFDCFGIFFTQDSTTALLNLANASANFTLHGSPTFTADRGFTGSSGNYVVITDPLSGLTNYTQNSAHGSVWVVTGGSQLQDFLGGSGSLNIYSQDSSNNAIVRVNDNPFSSGFAISTSTGFYFGDRQNSTARTAYKNGTSIGTYGSTPSGAIGAGDLHAPANNTDQIGACSVGGSMDATQGTFYTLLRAFATAVGVP